MTAIQPVSQRHSNKRWLRPSNYQFAAAIPSAPIAAGEFGECARALPLAFVEQQGTQKMVALFGLLPGQNLYIGPDGRWVGPYIPAVLRAYPFRLGQTETDALALCVDEESGLVQDFPGGEGGIPFFGENGQPHPATQKMADFLTVAHRGIQKVQTGVAVLTELDLLEPWPLKVTNGETEKSVVGISRVNEKKLNTMSGDDLVKLRGSGALAIAYGQLLSMGNISAFGTLGQFHKQYAAAKAARTTGPGGFSLTDDDGSLKFD